jgi:hypothetical protein
MGMRTRTLEQRLSEHWETAKGYTMDRFHKFLSTTNPADVEIHLIEQVKHTCKAEAELDESNLTNYYNESVDHNNDKLLDTKLSTNSNKQTESIKSTKEPHNIDIATYNTIKKGLLHNKSDDL